jgi:outer membrane receptor protein involved in Fe transport
MSQFRQPAMHWVATLVVAMLLTTCTAMAQTSQASLRGTVADQQGLVVAGARLSAQQKETNSTRTTVADSEGQFFLPNLPPGTYIIKAEHEGFMVMERHVVLQVGQQLQMNFTLSLGTVEQAVEVSGGASTVDLQTAVGANILPRDVESLPTVNRNFADLVQLAPGISSTGGSSMGFSAAGQHQYQNNIYVDGGTNAMKFYGTQSDSFPQDWIQEFQVMTNGYAAEFGNASGAVLNVITRSGTNAVHGRGYGFFQNGALNSPPYTGRYVNGGPEFLSEAPPYSQQRIGGYLGGPIVKDKLFLFGGFESLTRSATATLSISDYWRARGVESVIPASNHTRPVLAKADWNISDKNRLSVRFDRTLELDSNCSGQGGDGCNSQPNWTLEKRATFSGPIWSTVGDLASTVSNRASNDFRVYYGVNQVTITSNIAQKSGIALLSDTANLGKYSEKTFPGASFGASTTGGLEGETNLYLTDSFTYIVGHHQFKVGAQLSRTSFIMDIDASQKGRWGFTSDIAFDINNPNSYPSTYNIAIGTATYRQATWNPGFYAQDSWQVHKTLTLSLGARYDIDNSILIGNDLVDAYNKRFVANYGGSAPLSKFKRDINNIAPRVGLVWAPTASRNTTIRANIGLFYDQSHYNYNDVYINQTLLTVSRYSFNANDSTANPFWNPANTAAGKAALRAFLAQNYPNPPNFALVGGGQQVINGMAPDFRIPYTVQYSGGLTHQFGDKIFAQADYVYSRGVDALVSQNVNVTQNSAGTFVTIDPRFSSYSLFKNLAWTKYKGLQTRVEYRGGKARAGVSYTLAKTTSDTTATGVGGGAMTNPLDISVDAGPANEDRRHNLAINGSYDFPLGIQASTIFHYASALPWSVSSSTIVFARPEPRNSRRGDDYKSADIRVGKVFKFGERWSTTAFFEAFNLFDFDNFTANRGLIQSSQFGQPASEAPKRQLQFGFRVDF